jgi:hypothetical protein
MKSSFEAERRAAQVIVDRGGDPNTVKWMLEVLRQAGFQLADERSNELVCRWVDVTERAVPPEADTIIRTITRTTNQQSSSTTHWLDGLRGPHL